MLGRKFLCLLSGVLCMLKCIYLDIYLPSSLIPAELSGMYNRWRAGESWTQMKASDFPSICETGHISLFPR